MLEIRKLNAGYSGTPVLHDISVQIPPGQVTVILGPNGCGKSTLLKVICGIQPAHSGEVIFEGNDLLSLPQKNQTRHDAICLEETMGKRKDTL